MKPLLILTKNLLVEQTIQARLQELGYEVFCSETFLRKLYQRLNIKEVKENFQGVILNGTITDREAESIISTLEQQIPCFRKLDRDPTEQEEENIRKIGFCGWISDSQSSDRLRESLSTQFTTLDHQKNSQVSSLLQTSEELQKKPSSLSAEIDEPRMEIFSKVNGGKWRDRVTNGDVFIYLGESS